MKYDIELYLNYFLHPYIYIFFSIIIAVILVIFKRYYQKQKITFKQIKTFLLFDIGIYIFTFILYFLAFHEESVQKGIYLILGIAFICLIGGVFDND